MRQGSTGAGHAPGQHATPRTQRVRVSGQGMGARDAVNPWGHASGAIHQESVTQRVKMGRGDKMPFSRGRDPPKNDIFDLHIF